jgi:hypothetical protein
MKTVQVESYSGYRGEERPLRLRLEKETLEIVEVEDRWYSPGETYFRVVVANGDRYVLLHLEAQDVWSMEAFCRKRKESEEASRGRPGNPDAT